MANPLKAYDLLVASDKYVSADLSEASSPSVIILGLEDGIYYELRGVGARFWSLIQEPRSFSEVLSTILEEYDVESSRCESDLEALTQDLADRGMVLIAPAD